MILGCDIELEVEKVHKAPEMLHGGKFIEPQPFFVHRVATLEEYLACWPDATAEGTARLGFRFFYEVTTD